ncbi:MAG: MGMT family protein [Actinomycetales bacterium]|nr:MGMT family protein [Actinomycetales bacterium]
MDEELVERVLTAAELIPAGRIASYGDVAGLVDCGPRQVGTIMARYGSAVPWWRVTSSYGDLPLGFVKFSGPTCRRGSWPHLVGLVI